MTNQAKLTIRFTHCWISGTGAARGRHVDDICHRDRFGLPAMPMTQVKGQLRETAERLADGNLAGWTPEIVERMFGFRKSEKHVRPYREEWRQGALGFRGEARLSATAQSYFGKKEDARRRLFLRIAATKIDAQGAAEDKTLRAVEAAVPAVLEGTIERIGDAPSNWVTLLDAACAATLAFGKLKADGYGRAIVKAEERT